MTSRDRIMASTAEQKEKLSCLSTAYLLYQEARLASLKSRLVSEKKLESVQPKTYRMLQSKVFKLWEEFKD